MNGVFATIRLIAAVAYFGTLALPVVGAATSVAWVALVPIVVLWRVVARAQALSDQSGKLQGD